MSDDFTERRPYNAVSDFVDANVARGLGSKIAFIDPDRSLTYGELQARSRPLRQCAARARHPAGRARRAAAARHGRLSGGVLGHDPRRRVAIPLNTFLNVAQYAYILADCRATALVAAAPLAQAIWPIIDRLPHLRTVILVGAIADDKAAFPGRDVHLFEDVIAAADSDAVHRRHGVGRGGVLALHLRLDRRSEGRQARPFQPDGDGEAVRPGRARHRRGRRGAFGGEIVLRLWARQRHDLSAVGRRHRGAVARAAVAGMRCSR